LEFPLKIQIPKGASKMKGLVIVLLIVLISQASGSGIYTGSDGKQVAIGNLPKISVANGLISESDLAAALEANFQTEKSPVSSGKKIGLPTLNEFEELVENLSAGAQGKALAEKAKQEGEKKGWPVKVGKKDGDYYSVAVVNQNGRAVAVSIICVSQVMLTNTGLDKSMEVIGG